MGFGHSVIARRVRAFITDTRAGATAIASTALTVMTVGAAALITDHLWLVDQRDVLKTAAEAASLAATLDLDRRLTANPDTSDGDLETALVSVAERYVAVNLAHLPAERLRRAKLSLDITLDIDRARRIVSVTAEADLGGTLVSRALPLLGNYTGPGTIVANAGVQSEPAPVELVLAIDVSASMRGNMAGESRMAVVKDAAKRLVDILDPDGHNRVAVGVVPWGRVVRLDADAASEWARLRWASYPAERTYPVPYRCNIFNLHTCAPTPLVHALPAEAPQAWKGCFDGHRIRDDGIASVPAPNADGLFELPSEAPFAQSYFPPELATSYRCLDASEVVFYQNNCLESEPHKAQDRCETETGTGAFPTLVALSTNRAAITSRIDALAPYEGPGTTYSALGVLWAQRMLEPAWKGVWGDGIHPADPATSTYASLRKAIVLLTDGEDEYCGGGNADCSNSPLAVSRTEACTAAKARGTEIFVIAAMDPAKISTEFGQLLRDCSSESDQEYPRGTRRPGATYVFLENATKAQLKAAFADIAKQLRTLKKIS